MICFRTVVPSLLVLKLRGSIKKVGNAFFRGKKWVNSSPQCSRLCNNTTLSLLYGMSSEQRTLLWW